MVTPTVRCSLLLLLLCGGLFSTSKKLEDYCPKPAVPEDAILVTLLSDVNLTCVGCEGRVSWSRGSTHGRALNVTEGGHLVLRSVTYEEEDNYTCYKDGAPVCSVELMVKDQQQSRASLSCYQRHPTHNITCEWRPGQLLHPSSSANLIKVRVLRDFVSFPCTYDSARETFTCSALYNEGDSTKHLYRLCVSGRTDSALTAGLEAYARDLLHIGPPLHIRVTPVEKQARRLRVSWSRPEFWESPFYGLRYQVLYRVENSLHSSNGTTEDETFLIEDAVMGKRHLVRVRAVEEFQENWGAWSEEAAGTPWSEEATTTAVPSTCEAWTAPEGPEPEDGPEAMPPVSPRIYWVAPCVTVGLVVVFIFGLLIRNQEVKLLKLKWSFLRCLFPSSSKVTAPPPQANQSLLPSWPLSSPSSVMVSVPPLLDEK